MDFALTSMGRRRDRARGARSVGGSPGGNGCRAPGACPVLLGRPLSSGVACVPLAPIRRTDLFDLDEGVVDITTEPVQRGRIARLFFRTDDLDDLDLVDLKVGRDSQLTAAADVPPPVSSRKASTVSCELEAWQALSFRLRSRLVLPGSSPSTLT